MAFWGPSTRQREATGRLWDLSNWDWDQMQEALRRSNASWDLGDWANRWAIDYNLGRVGEGFGSPGDIRNWGREIAPEVDDVLARRWGRLGTIDELSRNIPTGGETADAIGGNLDQLLRNAMMQRDEQGREISDTYGRGSQRIGDAGAAIRGNITDNMGLVDRTTRDQLGRTGGAYNNLRSGVTTAYGDMAGDVRSTYGDILGDIERLRPTGDFAAARAARSFAPAMASTYDRLRRSGIDPNSPQAASLIGRVEAARGRAMDDAFAGAERDYVSRRTGAQEGRLDRTTGLGREAIGATTGLGQAEEAITRGIGDRSLANQLGLSGEWRGAVGSEADAQTRLDQLRSAQALQNTGQYYDTAGNVLAQRSNNELLRRALAEGDWNRASQILQGFNDEELTGVNLRNWQYNQGADWRNRDLAERNQGAANIGNAGVRQMDLASTWNQMGRGWGNDAGDYANLTRQLEERNSGWGARLLAGIAPAALSMIPGVGPMLGGMAAGALNAGGGMRQGAPGRASVPTGGFGSGWGGPQNPYVFSANSAAPQGWGPFRAPRPVNYNYYDPNRTQMQPNGTLMVGRY